MRSVSSPSGTVRLFLPFFLFLLLGPPASAEGSVVSGLGAANLLQEQEAPPVALEPEKADEEDEGAPALPSGAIAPLFAEHSLLEFTIEADFKQLRRDRREENDERPGILTITDDTGAEQVLDLKIRTRGNYRLKKATCGFPPLRLNFQKKQVIGSVFEYQDKVKLVAHCQDRGDRWEQQLLNEYAAYRIFNELSDRSFRARLARITYVNTAEPDDDPLVRLAFLIERDDQLAIRIEGSVMEVDRMHPGRYDGQQAGIVSLFQYLVGNTDFSMYEFHNMVPFRQDGPIFFPIPYDFDWTGLVSAPYAKPNEKLNVRTVRDRIYRGFCWPDLDYVELYQHFQDRREAIMAIYDDLPGISEGTVKKARRYLDQFYDVLESDRRRQREIASECRTW